MTENQLATEIVDAAYQVHKALGPGLLESAYTAILAFELQAKGLHIEHQQPIPLNYKGIHVDAAFRADVIVEHKVIIEVKSVEGLAPVHRRQLLTYLRLADMRLGLLINFNVVLIKDGIARVVNDL